MRVYLQKWIPLLCVLLFWQGCNTDKMETPILDTEVEKEYELDLWENLANSLRTFQIRVNTIKPQDCLNYQIESSTVRNGNNIEINLGKPQIPLTCERGSGPAKSNLDLTLLTNGTYNLTIKLGKIVPSTGRLTVSNNSFFLSMPTPIGFRVLHHTLLRVPDHTIWGYIEYEPSNWPVVDQFLQDLTKITQDAGLNKGYYGYFNIQDNGTMELGPQASTDRPIFPIARRFQANEKDLENFLAAYRDKYGKDLFIRLRNTNGKEY